MSGSLAKVQAELLKQKASVMKSLGLDDLDTGYDAALTAAAKAARKTKADAAADTDTAGVRRRSLRVKGIGPDGLPSGIAALETLESPSVKKFQSPEGDVPWHLILDAKSDYVTASNIIKQFRECTAQWMALAPPIPTPDSASIWDSVQMGDGAPDVPITKFAEALDVGLSERVAAIGPSVTSKPVAVRDVNSLVELDIKDMQHVVKAIPDRIYSIAFHPCSDKLIALCGGKEGRLGVWCPSFDTQNCVRPAKRARKASLPRGVADQGDDENSTCTVFRPHSAPINQFYVVPGAPYLVVTSSYDGTIRALDVNKGMFWKLFDSEEKSSISALDNYSTAKSFESRFGCNVEVILGTYDGRVAVLDTRLPAGRATCSFQAHERKVSSVSTLAGTSCFLSAGGDGLVKVWDMRNLSGSSMGHAQPLNEVALLRSVQSITSASFSAGGRHILATCNDNKLRVWDVEANVHKLKAGKSPVISTNPSMTISHDNHTGRWISPFRTIFDPANDDTMIVGNMKRFMDIYSVSKEDGLPLTQLHNELLTAIPTLNAVHPSTDFDVIVSGTASGRMYLWT